MITKQELLDLDRAMENFINVAKPIMTRITKSKVKIDCALLHGFGDTQKLANDINKSLKTVK